MSDEDLIRRGDAKRFAHQAIIQRGKHANAAASVDHALAALPAVDPLADPRVQALVKALWFLEIAATGAGVPHPQERKLLHETIHKARAALAEIGGDSHE
jgi:hypothetical protein